MQVQFILGLFFAVTIALFALQNTEPVTVRFLVFALERVALAVVILVTAALAAGATMLLGLARSVRHGAEVREMRRALGEKEAQIAQLQTQVVATAVASRAAPEESDIARGAQTEVPAKG